jgi:hypothetical protein
MAWDALTEVLPKGWRTGPPSFDPATQLVEIVALGPKHGGRHRPPPQSVSGFGRDEAAAVRDLADRLST